VNDSLARFANCRPKVVTVDGKPHLLLFALKVIEQGMELRYDYGTDSNLEWRKVRIYFHKL